MNGIALKMKIAEALSGVTRIGLDTDVAVYFVEARPFFGPKMQEIMGRIIQSEAVAFASTVTLLEGLVKPIQTHDAHLQRDFRRFLLNTSHVETLPVDAAVAERAADLRARYRMKAPDAIQAATALVAGCDAFLTNNGSDFRRVMELNVLVLDELPG